MTDRWSLAVTALVDAHPQMLTVLGASVLVCAEQGIAKDTRSFARIFDVEHALVIRECVTLATDHNLLVLDDPGDRSQRLFFDLTKQGHELLHTLLSNLLNPTVTTG